MRARAMRTLLLLIAFQCAAANGYGQVNVSRKDIPSGLSDNAKQNIEALYSPDAGKRAEAAFRLGQLNADTAATIPFLIALLNDGTAVSEQYCKAINASQDAPWGLDGEESRACSPGQA